MNENKKNSNSESILIDTNIIHEFKEEIMNDLSKKFEEYVKIYVDNYIKNIYENNSQMEVVKEETTKFKTDYNYVNNFLKLKEKLKSSNTNLAYYENQLQQFDPTKKYKVVNTLRDEIKKSQFTQKEIAMMVGTSERTLSELVANKGSIPNILLVMKICAVLGVKVDDVFKLVEVDK